ncbi:MAG TPA: hypothetical protein VHZ74_10015 [Bryobacteraceae bacterium]|jgi:hypothetical protein|nr:hypothetical protein [Bryobacteraceae bacterium]
MEHFIESRQTVQSLPLPNLQSIREEAVLAGALDPMNLMFQVLEYDKASGELLGVPMRDIGLGEAIEKTARLIEIRSDSHFFLHPVGFIQ